MAVLQLVRLELHRFVDAILSRLRMKRQTTDKVFVSRAYSGILTNELRHALARARVSAYTSVDHNAKHNEP